MGDRPIGRDPLLQECRKENSIFPPTQASSSQRTEQPSALEGAGRWTVLAGGLKDGKREKENKGLCVAQTGLVG